jgi:tryptophan-rich sensory protein
VFGVAWTCLYLLVGAAWVLAARINAWYDLGFLALLTALVAWPVIYGCWKNPRGALYMLVGALLVATLLVVSLAAIGSQVALLVVPLVVWLLFAMGLNMSEVNSAY